MRQLLDNELQLVKGASTDRPVIPLLNLTMISSGLSCALLAAWQGYRATETITASWRLSITLLSFYGGFLMGNLIGIAAFSLLTNPPKSPL